MTSSFSSGHARGREQAKQLTASRPPNTTGIQFSISPALSARSSSSKKANRQAGAFNFELLHSAQVSLIGTLLQCWHVSDSWTKQIENEPALRTASVAGFDDEIAEIWRKELKHASFDAILDTAFVSGSILADGSNPGDVGHRVAFDGHYGRGHLSRRRTRWCNSKHTVLALQCGAQ